MYIELQFANISDVQGIFDNVKRSSISETMTIVCAMRPHLCMLFHTCMHVKDSLNTVIHLTMRIMQCLTSKY